MCERTYCRHEHERLCSCPPVTCGDALGMAAHLAENMEQVQWSLTYNSLKDIKPYQLCLVGKCRICGGRLCMEQRPVEADSTDGFLAAVYRHLYHFHRSIGQCLPRTAFRTKFVEMFRKEDRAAIEDWLALPENSHVARMYRRSVKGAYIGNQLTLTCLEDQIDHVDGVTLAISNDMGVLLRKMLENLEEYDDPPVLTRVEKTISGFLFAYGGRDNQEDGPCVVYIVSETPVLPAKNKEEMK